MECRVRNAAVGSEDDSVSWRSMVDQQVADTRRAAQYWDEVGPGAELREDYWGNLQLVRLRLNQKITGNANLHWCEYTLSRHFNGKLPLENVLSLGCGNGHIERKLAEMNAFAACTGMDISEVSIAEARLRAKELGLTHIEYLVQDINASDLPHETYDAVWIHSAAHHFVRLEHAFGQISQSLRPDGLLIMLEYVGANRFQFGHRQRQVIEACHRLIPPRYRQLITTNVQQSSSAQEIPLPMTVSRPFLNKAGRLVSRSVDKLRDGDIWNVILKRYARWKACRCGEPPLKISADLPTARDVVRLDPTEAVRSSEIMPILKTRFDIIEIRPLGGTILQFLLANIAGNFADECGQRLLEMFFNIEDTMMANGELSSDFVYVVASPRQ
jgi:SAM-dependent methyltransferase